MQHLRTTIWDLQILLALCEISFCFHPSFQPILHQILELEIEYLFNFIFTYNKQTSIYKMRQLTNIPQLNAWVSEVEALCTPDNVYLCDGSKEEYDRLADKLVSKKFSHSLEN